MFSAVFLKFDNCRPEVASDVTSGSGVAVDYYVDMDGRVPLPVGPVLRTYMQYSIAACS